MPHRLISDGLGPDTSISYLLQSNAHIIYAPIGLDNISCNERIIFITLLEKELLCLVQYQIGFGLGSYILLSWIKVLSGVSYM